MCKFKSGIILRDRVYIPEHDDHTKMLIELNIEDSGENAERRFVRAELIPPDEDYFAPISMWRFNVDQDILPGWFVSEHEEARMREAIQAWADKHIHIDKIGLTLNEGVHFVKNCKVRAYGQSEVRAYGQSKVTAYGQSEVTAYGQSEVRAYDQSEVIAYGQSEVTACDQSEVDIFKLSMFDVLNLKLHGLALAIDRRTQTIYYADGQAWKLERINKEG